MTAAMLLRTRALVLLPALGVVASLLAARTARAETAPAVPRCNVQILPSGDRVPVNLPALVVDDRNSPGLTSVIDINELTGGTTAVKLGKVPDPKTPNVTLLVPSTNDPLEVGVKHSLPYTINCSNGKASVATPATFTTIPAVALPTTIGSAKELADGTAVITPSAELAAFLQTTRFEVFVDGASFGKTRYGSAFENELQIFGSGATIAIGRGSAFASNGTSLCTTGADKQKHEVKLVAHVAGAPDDTSPLTFSLNVDCTAPKTLPILPDGGGDDRGASGGSDGSGGCNTTGAGPIGSLAAFFAMGAGVVLLLRRGRAKKKP